MFSNMEHRMIQQQSQKLILSPQIRQYLKLLQLSTTDLENAIQSELTENPMLEEKKDPLDSLPLPSEEAGAEEARVERTSDEIRVGENFDRLTEMEDVYPDRLSDFSVSPVKDMSDKRNFQENSITRSSSLPEFLAWQTGFLDVTDEEKKIIDEIIGNIDKDGYLRASNEEIAEACGASPKKVEAVLKKFQTLDPPGIGARTIQDALVIQLDKKIQTEESLPESSVAELKVLRLALEIVKEHLPLLEKREFPLIAKKMVKSVEEVKRAVEIIARLEPKPARIFHSEEKIAVTPDAVVSISEDEDEEEGGENKLKIDILDERIPEIRINMHYKKMLQDPGTDEKARAFIRDKITSAMHFMKALSLRKSTLRAITEEIVSAQKDFFEKGFSFLKPLRLKDIAQNLRVHESTVSRAIQNKYLSTPQGMIPYKSFFSSRLETEDGGTESQKSILEKIKGLIAKEPPEHPLSDEKLLQVLKQEGLKIARRTVAKYREMLKIPPSHLRKRSA